MSFIFVICQAGAENALKHEAGRRHKAFRLAFSRPGFVTFKVPRELRRDKSFELGCVFGRAWGFSIGKVSGDDGGTLVEEFWSLVKDRFPSDILARFTDLHVWERDRHVPGDFEFEPGPSPLSEEIGAMIAAGSPIPLALNEKAEPDAQILDCVLVEPGEWWIGWHRAAVPTQTWVGGVPELEIPDEIVSRAYIKMAESLLWSELPIQTGDRAIEIGSSPGGSCQCLLDRGLDVVGIDPAEMDPRLMANPHFTHIRARAKDLKRRTFADARWLMSDATVAPNYTLDTVEAVVTHPSVNIEGLLLTLKMPDWELAREIPQHHKRIRGWGYDQVRSRQLAHNRREICVMAMKRPQGSTPGDE